MREFSIDKRDIPSYYKMTINRPKMLPFDVVPLMSLSAYTTRTMADINLTYDEATADAETIVPLQTLSATSFVGDIESGSMELGDAFDMLVASNNDCLKACKIDGCYDDYIYMMAKKLNNRNKLVATDNNENRLIHNDSNIIVIDSYDGAQHRKTAKNRTNIISFSSQMITKESIKAGYSTSVSRNILTWQQMIGQESSANLMPVLNSVYERKEAILNGNIKIETDCKFMNKDSKISLYDLHDGKMLYLLTQHSLFNRKFHPFLLCKCQRGEGVINNTNHECKIISHDEQIQYYNRSIKR